MSNTPGVVLVFAHGAGAGQSHPFMTSWNARLSTLGTVHAFEYPYMAAGSRRPDRMPTLLAAHREARRAARELAGSDAQVFLIGKSMGSRVGCHLANEADITVAGVMCFGYPLVGSSKKRPVRDAVLKELETPVLFIQGTRDKLCPLDHLAEVRAEMSAKTELHVVETGDHSLQTTKTFQKTTGVSQADSDAAMFVAIETFVRALS
ncbi:MAG: putative alpha/beta-hydrolase family hydrolase [Myxococcota bacterium]|jgi:predicted alpha/beta-hydrolase family hydrolase